MLLVNIFLTGGLVYTGVKVYVNSKPSPPKTKWLSALRKPQTEQNQARPTEKHLQHYLTASSISLGVSIATTIIYPPLIVASVPFTLYASLPIFEDAYRSLYRQDRSKVNLINTIIISGTILTNRYFTASFINWLYHYLTWLANQIRSLNQRVLSELEYSYRQFLIQILGRKPQTVWLLTRGSEIEIPFSSLKVGDVVVINEGEVMPVDGKIVEGSAVVELYLLTGQPSTVEMKSGDHIFALTMVLSGRISVQVERL